MMRSLTLLTLIGCVSEEMNVVSDSQGIAGIEIDSTAPAVSFDDEFHAAFFAPGAVTITGSVSDDASEIEQVAVDGEVVPVVDGRFSFERVFRPGAHTLTVRAMDAAGNRGRQSMTVMVGDMEPLRAFLDDAANVQLGHAVMDEVAEQLSADMHATMGLNIGDEFAPFGGCFSLDGTIDDIVTSERDVHIMTDPTEGVLYLDISYEFFSMDFSGTADICGVPEDFDAYITASRPGMRVTLAPEVDDTGVSFVVEQVQSSAGMYQVDIPALADDMAEWGYTDDDLRIDDAITDAFERGLGDHADLAEAVAAAVQDSAPQLAVEGVMAVETGFNTESVTVTDEGLFLTYSVWHGTPNMVLTSDVSPRWFRLAGDAPEPETADASVAFSIDAFNHGSFAAWHAGDLDTETEFVIGGQQFAMTVSPQLPPVVQADGAHMGVNFGEIEVTLYEVGINGYMAFGSAQVFANQAIRSDLSRGPLQMSIQADEGTTIGASVRRAIRAEITRAVDGIVPDEVTSSDKLVAEQAVANVGGSGWVQTTFVVAP